MTLSNRIVPERFVGVRRVVARQQDLSTGWTEPLEQARVVCRKGGPAKSALDCLGCPRFLAWQRGPGDSAITVNCRWTSEDPVAALMTAAASVVSVEPSTSLWHAEELARRAGVRHLAVVSRGDLIGILCRCDLVDPAPPDDTVGSRMSCPVIEIAPSASLGEALAVMNRCDVGCLPVVADGALVGVITRGDLRRVGVSEELLGAAFCNACGSTHGVRLEPRTEVELCLECIERARELADEEELGEGD